ncbi:UPF0280 family protein [Amylibacter sp. IMCC11727]|uniref:UPF0280 family protein n=1 Tax=Amylibacter sp. IMCC11727 TaxID=3039851 RepID=UPI00244DD4C4|nr:UPF0280 family protein [Amylibacter sp. IMCC11727]WGI23054.1 UPF0280 family protein [Amylibacter sp. IMCC11727]
MIAARISGGRLHLQHGPIDLIIGADGAREAAFAAAEARFSTVLQELVAELPLLRTAMPVAPKGDVARRMAQAASGHMGFVTPMAAVAGAVADEVLSAMKPFDISKAYVNNGGDLAIHLDHGRFDVGVAGLDATALGKMTIQAGDGIGGIATSGRGGRSLSLGIADSVTVLAKTAAAADVAATLIANAVNVDAPQVERCKACELDPDSDLGEQLVVTGCGDLTLNQIDTALNAGEAFAKNLVRSKRIQSAFIVLQGQSRVFGTKELAHA